VTLIALHLKSKAITGGREQWESDDFDERMAFIKNAVVNRRRIGAEVSRVRKWVDGVLMGGSGGGSEYVGSGSGYAGDGSGSGGAGTGSGSGGAGTGSGSGSGYAGDGSGSGYDAATAGVPAGVTATATAGAAAGVAATATAGSCGCACGVRCTCCASATATATATANCGTGSGSGSGSGSARIIICGDLNDGPGMDYFEANYLTVNSTDALLGSTFVAGKLKKI
jgi:hypothetical protein